MTSSKTILVTGATGYIGSAVVARLTRQGHDVVPLVKNAAGLHPDTPVRVGDLADPSSLRAAVTDDVDAVVNLATPTGDEAVDTAALEALVAPLRGTGRAYVYTSGVWVLGATGDTPLAEDAATDEPTEPEGDDDDQDADEETVRRRARERFAEAHEIVMKAWTEDGPWEFIGKHYQLRMLNTWPRPLQKPHPEVWIPGVGSRIVNGPLTAAVMMILLAGWLINAALLALRLTARTWTGVGRRPRRRPGAARPLGRRPQDHGQGGNRQQRDPP